MKKKTSNKKKQTIFSRTKKRFLKIKDAIFEDLDVEERTSFSILEVIGIIVVSILFGVVVGYVIMYSRNPVYQVGGNKNLLEIVNSYREIVDNYYGEIDEEKLADEAIKGMIQSLDDPNSNYMDQAVTSSFNETVDGSFVGIGVVIVYQGEYNQIIEIYEDSPAERAGLKIGDLITSIDGDDAKGLSGGGITSLVRGKEGTEVIIGVKRDEQDISIPVVRGSIALQSVSSDVLTIDNRKVGYIKISSFADNTYEQFSKALKKVEKENIDSLTLDVRDNPGGHLQQVTDILSFFFPKKVVLYQVQMKEKKEKVKDNTKDSRDYPIMVLINSGSASASEILASCFQENYNNAKIIGNTSYGKGTIQKSVSLASGTSFKYTVQKWLTSKGVWINDKGITPDIVVEQGNDYYDNPIYENDLQLMEALQQIKES